ASRTILRIGAALRNPLVSMVTMRFILAEMVTGRCPAAGSTRIGSKKPQMRRLVPVLRRLPMVRGAAIG
ncbi:hypothetical protein, partial [Aquibium carbonis]|uniref:hypothetical protein n=1 Tax=Aquibium carbonis TaxID=2495581 RepID=UPI001AEC7590